MSKHDVQSSVCEILEDIFDIEKGKLIEDNFNKLLTGDFFKLDGNDLVYLFFEIEKKFKVILDTSMLENYKFNTINGITSIIIESIS